MDETCFRIGVGGDQYVVTLDWQQQQKSASETNREYVTAIEAISADGAVLHPLLIAQGSVHLQSWYTRTDIPDEYKIALSSSSYAKDCISIEWVKHFEQHSARRHQGAWRLLIFDGYGSHCTLEFLEFCDKHKIVCFTLPPHSSQDLQPLDVSCFQPYKHYHRQAVEEATRTGCTNFNKLEFFQAFRKIREQTFKLSILKLCLRK